MNERPTNERRYVRVKTNSPVKFVIGKEQHAATVRDVSLCGAYIATDLLVEIGAKIRMETSLPDGRNRKLKLRGRIVRRVAEPVVDEMGRPQEAPGFGVDFGAVSLAARAAIDEYVRHTFRTFRKLQFELSRTDPDPKMVKELVGQTYLPQQRYGMDALRDLVAAELKGFRLRPV